ncbi:MAG: hypothetical protein WC650_01755 [Candidatus Doudnabacteria bacterium]
MARVMNIAVITAIIIITLITCDEETAAVWKLELVGQISLKPDRENPNDKLCAVHVSGQYAYAADVNGGLYVVDISDPQNPRQVGYCDRDRTFLHPHLTSRSIEERMFARGGVQVKGNYAYMVDDGFGGLRVIDISDPSKPREVGCSERHIQAREIYVRENYAYVTFNGLRVYDISNPVRPREVGICEIPSWTTGITVKDKYAYITNGRPEGGLWIIDTSDPKKPRQVGYCHTSGNAYGVDVVDNSAYVICTGGLDVIDISDPNTPHKAGNFPYTMSYARGLFIESNYAYAAYGFGGGGGIVIIDVSNPIKPKEVGRTNVTGPAQRIYVAGSYAYVVSNVSDLCIIKVKPDAHD